MGTARETDDQSRRHNLPVALTTFVGREAELASVAELLARRRLVTLTGPGGSGKTRTALEVARRVSGLFDDGVWLVELAQLDDPAQVPAAVASVLGIRAQPGRSMSESLASVIGGRHLLLILDNCEHLIEAAAEMCDTLLRAGDDLRVLATSREPLGVSGEVRYAMPPLPVPAADEPVQEARDSDAVTLFVERAAEAQPDFALTADAVATVSTIVRRLDGMPLAIELAAAQVDVLGLAPLMAGLDDRFRMLVSETRGVPARQASLAATVEWSYRLLRSDEQRAFSRLSVFPAPFTLEAATAAVGCDATDLVSRLVRRSLLVAPRAGADGQLRYGMLETLRAFASVRLDEAGERGDCAAAVSRWTLAASERAAAAFDSPDDSFAWLWGDAEQDNLRDALEWSLENDPEIALDIAIAVSPWWFLRGHYAEGQSFLARALAGAEQASADQFAAAEVWRGRLALDSGGFDVALHHFRRADELLAGQGPSALLADSLNCQTIALFNLAREDDARETGTRAMETARAAGHPSGVAYAHVTLSLAALYAGDFDAALSLANSAADVDSTQVRAHAARWTASTLADALSNTGDLDRAEQIYRDALELCRRAGDRCTEAMHLDGLSRIELRTGRPTEAAGHIAAAIRISAETGDRLRLSDCFAITAVWASSFSPEKSAVLWGAARSVSQSLGMQRPALNDITDRADPTSAYDSVFLTEPILRVREVLGPQQAALADERGATMGLDDAVAFALTVLNDSPQPSGGGERTGHSVLSKRERQLVHLVADGLTDRQIAEALFISIRTVRSHLDRIRDKTGARRRADLTRLALDSDRVTTSG